MIYHWQLLYCIPWYCSGWLRHTHTLHGPLCFGLHHPIFCEASHSHHSPTGTPLKTSASYIFSTPINSTFEFILFQEKVCNWHSSVAGIRWTFFTAAFLNVSCRTFSWKIYGIMTRSIWVPWVPFPSRLAFDGFNTVSCKSRQYSLILPGLDQESCISLRDDTTPVIEFFMEQFTWKCVGYLYGKRL